MDDDDSFNDTELDKWRTLTASCMNRALHPSSTDIDKLTAINGLQRKIGPLWNRVVDQLVVHPKERIIIQRIASSPTVYPSMLRDQKEEAEQRAKAAEAANQRLQKAADMQRKKLAEKDAEIIRLKAETRKLLRTRLPLEESAPVPSKRSQSPKATVTESATAKAMVDVENCEGKLVRPYPVKHSFILYARLGEREWCGDWGKINSLDDMKRQAINWQALRRNLLDVMFGEKNFTFEELKDKVFQEIWQGDKNEPGSRTRYDYMPSIDISVKSRSADRIFDELAMVSKMAGEPLELTVCWPKKERSNGKGAKGFGESPAFPGYVARFTLTDSMQILTRGIPPHELPTKFSL